MTVEQATRLKLKQIVVHPDTTPAWRPHKVKKVWVSKGTEFVRLQLTGYADQWLPADGWQLVPEGARWDTLKGWISSGGTRIIFVHTNIFS